MATQYLAVVTGAAQGIGLATAEALLKTGANVHILDINSESGLKTQNELSKKYGSEKVTFAQCDVSNKDQLEKAFYETKEKLGGLNVICNCAGILLVDQYERTRWEEVIAVNLSATVHACLLGLDLMDVNKGGKGGVIINVSSMAGMPPPLPLPLVYCTTKAGVVHLTKCAALTSLAKGIRINCVSPDAVDTQMLHNLTKDFRELNLFNTERYPFSEEDLHRNKLSPSEVVDEIMKLIVDESKNGEAKIVTKGPGEHSKKF